MAKRVEVMVRIRKRLKWLIEMRSQRLFTEGGFIFLNELEYLETMFSGGFIF